MSGDTESDFDQWSGSRLGWFRRRLFKWYRENGRVLPWRKTRDPYRVWISEIMLQQTTVAAVVPYFERFMARFPSVRELADAPEDEVLRHWEGLGYYSRARNIHKTAAIVVGDLGGRFPGTVDELQSLPGIGRYTAGAVTSFAFDRPAPIVEANTLRLYCRLLGYTGDPRSKSGQKTLWSFAENLVPAESPGRCNQALMELGSLVCKPVEPDCERCPVKLHCRAFQEQAVDRIPVATKRPEVTHVTEATFAVKRDGRYLFKRNPETERWAGLWDFPRFPVVSPVAKDPNARELKMLSAFAEKTQRDLTGISADVDALHTEMRHSVTRYRIRLLCFRGRYRRGTFTADTEHRWLHPEEFSSLPLSVTGRKFARLIAAHERQGG